MVSCAELFGLARHVQRAEGGNDEVYHVIGDTQSRRAGGCGSGLVVVNTD